MMTEAEVRVSERAVLEQAIKEIESGFTPDFFMLIENDDDGEIEDQEATPGLDNNEVIAVCAIGGVEQALWRLTGEAIPNNLRRERAYRLSPDEDDPEFDTELTSDTQRVYTRVMLRLNVAAVEWARERFDADDPSASVRNVEEVTNLDDHDISRGYTLEVFSRALADASLAEVS